jgi:chromosome segregation ATPase
MTTREEIENRLGIFARRALFDNCGIGPNGFQPGNDCGGKPGSGGSEGKPAPKSGRKAAKTDKTAKGIEERAKAAGKTFTEQWLEESRGAIDRDYETRERKASDAEQRKADARVRQLETALEETKARGPQPAAAESPRMAEISGNIAALEARLAETNKTRDEARARADAIAEERKANEGNIAEAKRRLEESKARSRALSRALRGL